MTTGSLVRVIGGLFTGSLLDRIAAGDPKLPGTTPESYHQESSAELNQAIHRSWLVLTGRWASFQLARNGLPEGDRATALTRDRWLLPLLTELGYGRLPAERPVDIDGRSFPVSHRWAHAPIHLIGAGDSLDRPHVKARGTPSPHGLVQDLLNSAEDRLWGLLSNGLQLRLLRDHRSLTRQAFVEFDLESMFDEEAYAAFRVLWLLCHQSRVEGEKASDCCLERWFQVLRDDGVPAMDRMREGVEQALVHLGNGFLRHRDNAALFARLSSGDLSPQDYYRQLLRLAYRLIFLLVAERRGLLLDPASPEAHERYSRMYAVERLRLLASKRRGGPHGDSWITLRLVMRHLDRGCAGIALPGLGSFLWRTEALPDLDPCSITNEDLFAAMRALGEIQDGPVRRPVDWASVQSDELGSIYEALMERVPRLSLAASSFELTKAGGNERKTTGSYYTPSSLVDCLLDTALDPVLDEACAKPDPEAAILDLAVVDPACGSGHFLVAAARRIAVRLARVRSGGLEPSPPEVQHALREVVSRCIYGVDINPMAVELCKVSLWMEALEPGKPLSFLEGHIRCGNALVGATPELMAKGIPDEAWEPIEGDEREACKRLKKTNRTGAQGALFGAGSGAISVDIARNAARALASSDAADDDTPQAIEEKERAYRQAEGSESVQAARLLADLWCSAFVWPKTAGDGEVFAPTRPVWERVKLAPLRMPEPMLRVVDTLRTEQGFLHWHLAFPTVIARGGFDCVVGNPPWERVAIQEKEYFARVAPEIADAPNQAERERRIRALASLDSDTYGEFLAARRRAEGTSQFLRSSGQFPLCGSGDVNTYWVFSELALRLAGTRGRVGLIVPTGILTETPTQGFSRHVVGGRRLVRFWDFQNRRGIFPSVATVVRFSLLTLSARPVHDPPDLAFLLLDLADAQLPGRRISLSAEQIARMSPNTGTILTITGRAEAEILDGIYARLPPLIRDVGGQEQRQWGVGLGTMFHMSADSSLFKGAAGNRPASAAGASADGLLPLFEAKLVHQFNHRHATYDGGGAENCRDATAIELRNPDFEVRPRYWVEEAEVRRRVPAHWDCHWLLGWRNICRSTDERTVIAFAAPLVGFGHSVNLLFPEPSSRGMAAAILANLNSMVLDFCARQRLSGVNLTFGIFKQLPVVPAQTLRAPAPWAPDELTSDWLTRTAAPLLVTSRSMSAFADSIGADPSPSLWDEVDRRRRRALLDAAFFVLYGLDGNEARFIVDHFDALKTREIARFGSYEYGKLVLDAFARMGSPARGSRTREPTREIIPAP